MKKQLLIFFTTYLLGSSVYADAPIVVDPYADIKVGASIERCQKQAGDDHSALTECLTTAFQESENEFSKAVTITKKQMNDLQQASSSGMGATEAFIQSTKAFENYREKACQFVYKSYASGSGAGQGKLMCQIKLTEEFTQIIT
jgi:uncharacterized protein YecT (DUF1311 family)